MEESVLEMAKDLISAQIQSGHLTPDNTQQALADTHAQLMMLQARGEPGEAGVVPVTGSPPGATNWRGSITRHVIKCLECGAVYKQLSIRHLREHDLTARSYREKYGIPRTVSLAAKDTTARRRQVVQETRPWEKTPGYLAMQEGKAAVAKKKSVAKRGRET